MGAALRKHAALQQRAAGGAGPDEVESRGLYRDEGRPPAGVSNQRGAGAPVFNQSNSSAQN